MGLSSNIYILYYTYYIIYMVDDVNDSLSRVQQNGVIFPNPLCAVVLPCVRWVYNAFHIIKS